MIRVPTLTPISGGAWVNPVPVRVDVIKAKAAQLKSPKFLIVVWAVEAVANLGSYSGYWTHFKAVQNQPVSPKLRKCGLK
jgi:hypothetical protein